MRGRGGEDIVCRRRKGTALGGMRGIWWVEGGSEVLIGNVYIMSVLCV